LLRSIDITPHSGFSFPADPNIAGRLAATVRLLEKQLLAISESLEEPFLRVGISAQRSGYMSEANKKGLHEILTLISPHSGQLRSGIS